MTDEMSLAVFDPCRALAAKAQEEDAALTFDHTTPEGEKELRSWVHKVRGYRSGLEKIRVRAKADALEYGRKVDDLAKELKAPFDKIITERMKPLDEIEDTKRKAAEAIVEAERVAKEKAEADRVADLQRRELKVAADEAKIKSAEDAANAEQQEIHRVEWGRGIAARATETATKLAEAKAAKEALALKKSIAATEAASQAKKDRLAEIESKRVADQTHRDKVEREAAGGIVAITKSEELAAKIVAAIMSGKIPHVTINY